MNTKGEVSRNLQKQLSRLFFTLVLIATVNAAFFWKTLDRLFSSYHALIQGQQVVNILADLERHFFEENKFRNAPSESGQNDNLTEIRKKIKQNFKTLNEIYADKTATQWPERIKGQLPNVHQFMVNTKMITPSKTKTRGHGGQTLDSTMNTNTLTNSTTATTTAPTTTAVVSGADETQASDKQFFDMIKKLEKTWHVAHGEMANVTLLGLTRGLIGRKQAELAPLEKITDSSTKALAVFVGIYLFIFFLTVVTMSHYIKRRLFVPLTRLSEKMKFFSAGHHELPPQTDMNDEISNLESQFYDMAGRVSHTFKDLQELDRVKTDFLSIASHELRTPMTSVKGSLSLILSGSIDEISPDVKELLTIAEKETDRLIRLINDILDLTKMETKKLPLNKKWSNLASIIESAVDGMKGFCEMAKVKIELTPSDHLTEVNVDRDRIQQVITNLASNAVKFSPPGSTVHIAFSIYENKVVVTVKDAGEGIEPENLDHMFEKFRSTDSKSKMIKGTGLGLPICKALIEQHGGTIGVESELNVGSTFYFTLTETRSGASNSGQAA